MADRVGEHTFDYQTVRDLTAVRAEPRADAEQVTQVLPGEPLAVEELRDGWARVRTAYDYPGWIRADALGGDPDPDWLAPTTCDPLEHGRSLLGTPYEWGGMTGAGVDCSGLVHMSFRATGRLVPRDADQQEQAGTPVAEAELRPGDVITYGDSRSADHIAFWAGEGRILHATGREGFRRVVEEAEPDELRARRRKLLRLDVSASLRF
jgi:gamma-D-glutamyl-L-lysine dipeptidyl-peptidase